MVSEPENERIRLTTAESRAQRRRSIAIGVTLVAMVVMFYVVTLIKMGAV
ncbi:hypothetical protein [Aureimonas sp. AU12]|nr:hypothetical protein [Aureimonas sp. AU12]